MLLGSRADIDDIARAFEKVYEHRAALNRPRVITVSSANHPALQNGGIVRALTALSENTYLSAIRAGMVVGRAADDHRRVLYDRLVPAGERLGGAGRPYLPLLQVPVTATFGLLAVFACFSIAYDLGRRLKQEAIVSASMATVAFLMIQLNVDGPDAVDGQPGLAAACSPPSSSRWSRPRAEVFHRQGPRHQDAGQRAADRLRVVPLAHPAVLPPRALLVVRFVPGVDINHFVQAAFAPLVFALNTLPGILVYACWSRCSGRSGSMATTPSTPSWRRSSSSTWRPMWRR